MMRLFFIPKCLLFRQIANPVCFVQHIMAFADLRLQEIRLGKKLQKKTVIITGEIGAGKTATIKKLVEQFRNEGLTVGGFYQQRILENNETIGYDYIETDSGKQIEFLRKKNSDMPKAGQVPLAN